MGHEFLVEININDTANIRLAPRRNNGVVVPYCHRSARELRCQGGSGGAVVRRIDPGPVATTTVRERQLQERKPLQPTVWLEQSRISHQSDCSADRGNCRMTHGYEKQGQHEKCASSFVVLFLLASSTPRREFELALYRGIKSYADDIGSAIRAGIGGVTGDLQRLSHGPRQHQRRDLLFVARGTGIDRKLATAALQR